MNKLNSNDQNQKSLLLITVGLKRN